MSIDKRNQLKISYQDFILFQGKQIIKQMSSDSLRCFLETVQARTQLNGETVANKELCNEIVSRLNKLNGGIQGA